MNNMIDNSDKYINKKRSVIIQNHQTSFAIEGAFLGALKKLSEKKGVSISSIIDEVDRIRYEEANGATLVSVLRVYILEEWIKELGGPVS